MMEGKQIKTLDGLMKAVTDRRAVIVPSSMIFRRPRPAAVVVNMQARIVYNMIRVGMFIYKKGK